MSSERPRARRKERYCATRETSVARTASLAPVFLSGVSEPARISLEKEADLEQILLDLVRSAKAAWPPFSLTDPEFVAFVAERLGASADPRAALLELRADDLFLACACSASVPAAHAAFKKQFDNHIVRAVRRFSPCPESPEDIQQIVYEKLFVGGPDAVPKISQYRGRGSLLNWIRVVVVRVAQNLGRGHRRQPAEERDSLLAFGSAASPAQDPELAYLKLRYGDVVRVAIRRAIASLTADERNILRYRYREGLAVEAIARIYRTHRTTMTRRIFAICRKVLDDTRAAVSASLDGTASEISSIMRLAPSQLGVTLASVELWGERR